MNYDSDIDFESEASPVIPRIRKLWINAFIAFLILCLILVWLWPLIVHNVQSGQAGVLYRRLFGGTEVTRVYGEGIQLTFPWDRLTIYDVRIQAKNHEFTVLTQKGLPITLHLTIRYQPDYDMLGLLHQKVGPRYLETIVIPQIESVIRKIVGQYDPEVIYTTKYGLLDQIIIQSLEEAGQNYVLVEDVIVRSVVLPESIKSAIEEKLVFEQKFHAYQFRLGIEEKEAERKAVEANGIRNFQEIISKSLNKDLLAYRGIEATEALAKSANSKVVVIGNGDKGLPVILGGN